MSHNNCDIQVQLDVELVKQSNCFFSIGGYGREILPVTKVNFSEGLQRIRDNRKGIYWNESQHGQLATNSNYTIRGFSKLLDRQWTPSHYLNHDDSSDLESEEKFNCPTERHDLIPVPTRSPVHFNTNQVNNIYFRLYDNSSNSDIEPSNLAKTQELNIFSVYEKDTNHPSLKEDSRGTRVNSSKPWSFGISLQVRLFEIDEIGETISINETSQTIINMKADQEGVPVLFTFVGKKAQKDDEEVPVGQGKITFYRQPGRKVSKNEKILTYPIFMNRLRQIISDEYAPTTTNYKFVITPHFLLNLESPKQCFFAVKSSAHFFSPKPSKSSTPTTVFPSNNIQWQDTLNVSLTDKEIKKGESLYICVVDHVRRIFISRFVIPVQDIIPGEQYTFEYSASCSKITPTKIIFSLSLQLNKRIEENFYLKNPTCHKFDVFLHGINPKTSLTQASSDSEEQKYIEVNEKSIFHGSALALLRIVPSDQADSLISQMPKGIPINKKVFGETFNNISPNAWKFSAARANHGFPEWSKNFVFNLADTEKSSKLVLVIAFYELRMPRNEASVITFVGYSKIALSSYFNEKGNTHVIRSEMVLGPHLESDSGLEVALSLKHWSGKSYYEMLSGEKEPVEPTNKRDSLELVGAKEEKIVNPHVRHSRQGSLGSLGVMDNRRIGTSSPQRQERQNTSKPNSPVVIHRNKSEADLHNQRKTTPRVLEFSETRSAGSEPLINPFMSNHEKHVGHCHVSSPHGPPVYVDEDEILKELCTHLKDNKQLYDRVFQLVKRKNATSPPTCSGSGGGIQPHHPFNMGHTEYYQSNTVRHMKEISDKMEEMSSQLQRLFSSGGENYRSIDEKLENIATKLDTQASYCYGDSGEEYIDVEGEGTEVSEAENEERVTEIEVEAIGDTS